MDVHFLEFLNRIIPRVRKIIEKTIGIVITPEGSPLKTTRYKLPSIDTKAYKINNIEKILKNIFIILYSPPFYIVVLNLLSFCSSSYNKSNAV